VPYYTLEDVNASRNITNLAVIHEILHGIADDTGLKFAT
jgi:hypothetical protein